MTTAAFPFLDVVRVSALETGNVVKGQDDGPMPEWAQPSLREAERRQLAETEHAFPKRPPRLVRPEKRTSDSRNGAGKVKRKESRLNLMPFL